MILALDGLNLEQAQVLASKLSCFADLRGKFSKLNGSHSAVQSVWSEILTGKPWFEVGCPGYSRPNSSLTDLRIIDEADLLAPAKLTGGLGSVTINVPLLRPQSDRIWLSDGSLPMQVMVSPAELAQQAPFSHYVARAFASTNIALANVGESVVNCLEVESIRLNCFENLLDRDTWSRCILRISVFDILSHLVGNEFLTASNLSVSAHIDRFIERLDKVLRQIERKGLAVCLLSAYSHVDCYARVNLNRILELSGFCHTEYAGAMVVDERTRRRAVAANLVNAANGGKVGGFPDKRADGSADKHAEGSADAHDAASADKHAAVSSSMQVIAGRSVAMSPVQGAIYINRKDRFVDGVVEAAEYIQVRRQVRDALRHQLTASIGAGFTIWENTDEQEFAPDLMVFASGVDFHDSSALSAVDLVNRPRCIHCAQGFVWLPAGLATDAQVLAPVQVGELLINGA